MKKVYLAKSNRANPNLVSKVRETLSKFNIEIVEYTGGQYSHNALLKCEELIVIPDISESYENRDNWANEWVCPIGKGLYEQISVFKKEIFIVTDFDSYEGIGGIYFDLNEVKSDEPSFYIEIEDERDYIKHSILVIDLNHGSKNPWDLYDYMLEANEIKTNSNNCVKTSASKVNSYRLLLTKGN